MVSTYRAYFDRNPIRGDTQIVDDNGKTTWYAEVAGPGSRVVPISAALAKTATVPDNTHPSTVAAKQRASAERKATRDRRKRYASIYG